jgi:hypothetical protein
VHDQVRVAGEDREGRITLAGYMIRAPMSLAKMSYDAATGTVIYRSKMHLGLWAPEASERGPPVEAPPWPANATVPPIYHPVPDIRGHHGFR